METIKNLVLIVGAVFAIVLAYLQIAKTLLEISKLKPEAQAPQPSPEREIARHEIRVSIRMAFSQFCQALSLFSAFLYVCNWTIVSWLGDFRVWEHAVGWSLLLLETAAFVFAFYFVEPVEPSKTIRLWRTKRRLTGWALLVRPLANQ